MDRFSIQGRTQALSCLEEGNSIRATSRMISACKNTVVKLLVDMGAARGLNANGWGAQLIFGCLATIAISGLV
jgi:hypothetical protein